MFFKDRERAGKKRESTTEIHPSVRLWEREKRDYVFNTQYVEVGDGQKLFCVEWGNPKGIPVIGLHGGPGGGISTTYLHSLDPQRYHVVLFDQRGCGDSSPSTKNMSRDEMMKVNTSDALVKDTEIIRNTFFKDKKAHILGASWGSTLALLYAIQYPDRVSSLQISAVFLGTEEETHKIFSDRTNDKGFPFSEEWRNFINLVPVHEREENGVFSEKKFLAYITEKVFSSDIQTAYKFAYAYYLYELTLCNVSTVLTHEFYLGFIPKIDLISKVKTELLYLQQNCFLENGYIEKNISKIKNIPCFIQTGSRDWVTPKTNAYRLRDLYGAHCTLVEVDRGHEWWDDVSSNLTALSSKSSV